MANRNRRERTGFGTAGAAALLAGLALLLVGAAPASAGRLLVTGHDADLHCSSGSGCHFVEVAVNYVRSGAPTPSNPVLVLDRGGLQLELALDAAFGAGVVPRVVMDPRSPAFASEPLTTARYSAILVASDTTCGGCDLNEFDSTPDSDAINARKDDITAFFNDGGGVYANSGGSRGDGEPSTPDVYYDFLPLPAGGQPVIGPFCLTPVGAFLGFEDQSCPDVSRQRGTNDDINCCATHNSFQQPPSGSALQIAELDVAADGVISADDVPETLIADGVASGGDIVNPGEKPPPPVVGKTVTAAVVKGEVLIKKGSEFVPLTEARSIPVGSTLDTRKGTVKLSSARNKKGKTQSGQFAAGVFQVLQSRKQKMKGLTELRLKGSSAAFKRCRSGKGSARASGKRRRIRRLRGNAKGRYRTRGRHSAATVRGTTWITTDRCDGTLTKVTRGSVSVRDFRLKKTIVVKRGKRYLAKAPGA